MYNFTYQCLNIHKLRKNCSSKKIVKGDVYEKIASKII